MFLNSTIKKYFAGLRTAPDDERDGLQEADDSSMESSPPDSPHSSTSEPDYPLTEYFASKFPPWDRSKLPEKSILKTFVAPSIRAAETEREALSTARYNAYKNKMAESAESHPKPIRCEPREFIPTPRIDPEDRDLRIARCRPGSPTTLIIDPGAQREGRGVLIQAPIYNLDKPPVSKRLGANETPLVDPTNQSLLMYRHSNIDVCDPGQTDRVDLVIAALVRASEQQGPLFERDRPWIIHGVPHSHVLSPVWLTKFGITPKRMDRPSPPPSPPPNCDRRMRRYYIVENGPG